MAGPGGSGLSRRTVLRGAGGVAFAGASLAALKLPFFSVSGAQQDPALCKAEDVSATETSYAIVLREPAPLPAEVPLALRRLVDRCLEKDREKRLASAQAILEALRAPQPRRRWWPAALVLLAAAAGLLLWRGPEPAGRRSPGRPGGAGRPAPRRPRSRWRRRGRARRRSCGRAAR